MEMNAANTESSESGYLVRKLIHLLRWQGVSAG